MKRSKNLSTKLDEGSIVTILLFNLAVDAMSTSNSAIIIFKKVSQSRHSLLSLDSRLNISFKSSLSVPIQEEVICFGPGIEVCDDCKPVCGCNQIPVLLCRKRRNCTREERGISVLGRMSARCPEL